MYSTKILFIGIFKTFQKQLNCVWWSGTDKLITAIKTYISQVVGYLGIIYIKFWHYGLIRCRSLKNILTWTLQVSHPFFSCGILTNWWPWGSQICLLFNLLGSCLFGTSKGFYNRSFELILWNSSCDIVSSEWKN